VEGENKENKKEKNVCQLRMDPIYHKKIES